MLVLIPGFVHEDQAVGVEAALERLPARPLSGDGGARLLSGEQSFFEAQSLAPEEAPDGVSAHHDPRSGQQVPKPVDRQMRRPGDQPVNQLPVRLQEPGAVTADLARRHTPRRPEARNPLRHRGDADAEARRHLADRLARQMGPHHALAKITRIGLCQSMLASFTSSQLEAHSVTNGNS